MPSFSATARAPAGITPVGGRETGHPLRVRVIASVRTALGALPSVVTTGPAVSTGGDRQPGAVGAGRPARSRAVRRGTQHPAGVDRPATGGQRPGPRLHRPAVAGGRPDPGPWQDLTNLDVVQTGDVDPAG